MILHKQTSFLRTAIFGLLLLATCATGVEAQSNTFPTTGNAGIGTTTPDAKLVVTSNTGTLPSSTGIARFAEADGVQTLVFLDGFNANGGFLVRRANASAASPSAVLSGDLLGVFGAAGYGTSAYSGTRASVAFGAAENWTNTANGTFITFNTTANGSATESGTERMRINSAGNIGLGTSDIENWTLATSVIESLNTSIFFGQIRDLHLNSNAYHNSGWKYKGSSYGAANYYLHNGTHYWRVAPVGTADSTITWNDAMTLNNSGNLGLGTTTPGAFRLAVTGNTDNTFPNGPTLMRLQSTTALGANVGSGINFSGLYSGTTPTTFATISGLKENATDGNYAGRLVFGTRTHGAGAVDITRMVINSTGNVGIGTANPGAGHRLDVQGGSINASGGLCIAGVCKTAWSQVTEASQWTTASGPSLHYTGGNVGIGTTSPTQGKLVVGQSSSSANFANKGLATSVNGGIATVNAINSSLSMYDGTSIHAADVGILYNGSTYKMVLSVNDDTNGSPGNVMTLQGGGNVGIGTTSPQRLMSLYKSSGPVLQLVDNLSGTTANDGLLLVQDGLNSYLENSEAGSVNFRTSATTRMTINASGDVGVGTAAPNYKLDVAGIVNSSSGGFRFPDGTVQLTAASSGGGSQWTTSGSQIYYNSGNVGIGTTTPAGKLEVKSAASTHNSLILNTTTTGFADSLVFQEAGTGKASIQHNPAVSAGALLFNTNGIASPTNTRMVINSAGNVGIGTTAPSKKLLIQSDTANDHLAIVRPTSNAATLNIGIDNTGPFVESTTANKPISFYTHNGTAVAERVRIDKDGNVGIGITAPTTKLHVVGSGHVTQNFTVDGIIHAKYQDVAEWVPSTHALPAGTVVTLDPTKSNHVEASSKSYDTRVAGVISAQPGIALGEAGDNKVLVATTGRVRVMVDASAGPIGVGDLLVTSDIAGVAMKSEPVQVGKRSMHMPGTLIGKALEPLEKGRAQILVLLSLQ